MPEQQQMTEEQAKALQEKLKNMSPEELKKFQKKQCIFCQIVSGKVASKKIYEDDVCIAILDINPANPGHVLLMPKEHYPIMPMIPNEELAHISMVAKALSHVMLKALKVQGVNIFIANGTAAGQRAQHFMLHVIPRKEGDKLPLDIPQKEVSDKELSEMRKVIEEKIGAALKVKKKVRVEAEPEEKEERPQKKEVKKKVAKKKETEKKLAAKKKKPKKKPPEEPEEEEPEEEEGGIGLDQIAKLLQ